VNINTGVLYQYNQKAADDLKAMDAKIAEVRGRKPPEDFICVLTERPTRCQSLTFFTEAIPNSRKKPSCPVS